jgi:orotidine-5'-phosphate decarboxylase
LTTYLEKLAARSGRVGNCLCLGIDPDPTALPAVFSPNAGGIEAFATVLLEAAVPYAAAVKVNLAFFEAFGSEGVVALERLRRRVPPDVPFIADAKRGDIGSTAARQAVALFDHLGADAVTLSPYVGRDAVAPFLEEDDRFVYVLCRTSNPGAGELQDLTTSDGDPIYLAVARRVAAWAAGTKTLTLGLVVGATAPAELARVRAAVPGLPFLVPGVGAQGGDLAAVMSVGPAIQADKPASGGSLLVNVSRGIAAAALSKPSGKSVEDAFAEAAADWASKLRC